MRRSLCLLPIIFLSGLLLFMGVKQFGAAFYWRTAHRDGQEMNETIGYLEKCVALDDKNALFHFFLGRAYLAKGLAKGVRQRQRSKWVRKSIDEFHKAIELKPSASDYHFHLGISYGALGYPPAFYWTIIEDSFERTSVLNPTDVLHLHSIGMYYLGEYQRLKHIGLIIEGIESTNNRNYLAMSKENYERYFRRLVDVNEEYLGKILNSCFSVTQKYADLKSVIGDTARSHALLARFLNGKGMWEEARMEFREAIDLDPTNPIYYSSFAHALFRRGDYEGAIYWWQKQKALDPEDGNPYLFSANGFMKLRQFDDALRELRDLITLHPENIHYRAKLMRILLVGGHLDEAVDEYHKMMGKNPNLSKDTCDAVRYYQRKGDYRKAAKILRKAISSALNR